MNNNTGWIKYYNNDDDACASQLMYGLWRRHRELSSGYSGEALETHTHTHTLGTVMGIWDRRHDRRLYGPDGRSVVLSSGTEAGGMRIENSRLLLMPPSVSK